MKIKSVVTAGLLLFVAVSLVYLAVRQSGSETTSDESTVASRDTTVGTDSSESAAEHQVIAYYFHGDKRCPTCLKIEDLSRRTLESGFYEELQDGRLQWQVVNFEEAGNEHYAEQFQLHTQTLILVDERRGRMSRWRNLDRVWELIHDEPAFEKYVQRMTRLYVEGFDG